MSPEVKAGQSTDPIKETLLKPILTNEIINQAKEDGLEKVSVIDFGTGDSSYITTVASGITKEVKIENLAVLDVGTEKFLDINQNLLSSNIPDEINMQVVDNEDPYILESFLNKFGDKYDVATAQLIIHQIMEDSEMSFLLYTMYQSLRNEGTLFLIDLHPQFIEYLADEEPKKFETISREDEIVGHYNFDSGGFITTKSRKLEQILRTAITMGFELKKYAPIGTYPIKDMKKRYQEIVDRDIPMFYLMQLKKSESNFISSSKGIIKSIKSVNDKYIEISFLDDDKIVLPEFDNWNDVKEGDIFDVLETVIPKLGYTSLNYWVRPGKRSKAREMISCQKSFMVQKANS